MRLRANKTSLNPPIPSRCSFNRNKAVPLLQFFFVCASVVSCVAFGSSLFVPQEHILDFTLGCS